MTLSDLLGRVEGAAEGSRELDCWIGSMADLEVDGMKWSNITEHGIEFAIASASRHQSFWFTALPAYSTNIDAALALTERLHPWVPWVDIDGMNRRPDSNGIWKVTLDGKWKGRSPTLPLAIIAAALRALIQLETQGRE